MLTRKYKQKPAAKVLAEIDRIISLWPRPFIEFADDNSFVNRAYWHDLLPELAKLSPQGNVHARTLYAAINLIKRTPPGPLFAALITQSKFRAMGDGYWLAR